MRILVSVKAKHIRNGECTSMEKCAIAQALRDIPGVTYARVGGNVQIKRNGIMYCAKLTDRADRFISKFDQSKKSVKPQQFLFTFTMA